MASMVKVRQVVTTVETNAGVETWVVDGPSVAGMVAGGYWEIVERAPDTAPEHPRRSRKAPVEAPAEVVSEDGGEDPS